MYVILVQYMYMYRGTYIRELGSWVASAKGPLLERMPGEKKKQKKKKNMQEQEDSKLVQNEGAGLLKFFLFFFIILRRLLSPEAPPTHAHTRPHYPTPGFLISLNISLQLKSKAVGDSPFLIFFFFFFLPFHLHQSINLV